MANLRPWLIPVLVVFGSVASARGEIRTDFEFEQDPEIHVPDVIKVFSKRFKPLWLEALARPEVDMQRMAADAIDRAHAAGCPNLEDAASALTGILTDPKSHPAARHAAAKALVSLQSKATAAILAESAEKYGADLRLIVEPALASWNYEPHRAIWQGRLTKIGVHRRDLILAMRCLATAGDDSHVATLVEIAHDRYRPPDVRLEAANAAGLLQGSGLEADARRLISGAPGVPVINRLCAARLLGRHGADAQMLLSELATDAEPAVAVLGLRRLIEIDPHLALPLVEKSMQNADANVRQTAADPYILLPDPQRVAVLARLLDDPHPTVRRYVCNALHQLAQRPELDQPIRQVATGILAGDRWRGIEQAALLLSALDHKPAAGRLVELLEFDRPEVRNATGWGLKKLAIPETLPAMLDKARRSAAIARAGTAPGGQDEQTAHLFEAFGRMKYTEADSLMREYVPKNLLLGINSRSAAIWSLGLLHAGVPDEQLAAQFLERANDLAGIPPEMPPVREMSIVSIGRMKAVSQIAALQAMGAEKPAPSRVGMIMRWSLMELTGKQIPEPKPMIVGETGWFLEPVDE
ncbi:MAG: HEAT repeat domain-containing protein [Planctomycetia bacterium]|nr:HEAT repeat domain-containing protein [Planctomycetia bacterium]